MELLRLVESEDKLFDLLEKLPADHPLMTSARADMWLEAKRAIREYFCALLDKTV